MRPEVTRCCGGCTVCVDIDQLHESLTVHALHIHSSIPFRNKPTHKRTQITWNIRPRDSTTCIAGAV